MIAVTDLKTLLNNKIAGKTIEDINIGFDKAKKRLYLIA